MEETADQKTERAKETSKLCNAWLEHPAKAHQDHEFAASAHDNEAFGLERERHLAMAVWHRKAAGYWAKKELEWTSQKIGGLCQVHATPPFGYRKN